MDYANLLRGTSAQDFGNGGEIPSMCFHLFAFERFFLAFGFETDVSDKLRSDDIISEVCSMLHSSVNSTSVDGSGGILVINMAVSFVVLSSEELLLALLWFPVFEPSSFFTEPLISVLFFCDE